MKDNLERQPIRVDLCERREIPSDEAQIPCQIRDCQRAFTYDSLGIVYSKLQIEVGSWILRIARVDCEFETR